MAESDERLMQAFAMGFEAGESSGSRKAQKLDFVLAPTWKHAWLWWRKIGGGSPMSWHPELGNDGPSTPWPNV